jgi:glucosamine kinase
MGSQALASWRNRNQALAVEADALFLGVDGGGTQCRARLCDRSGSCLGEGIAGPANIRLGLEESFASVHDAAMQCLRGAGLSRQHLGRIMACLALAGVSEPAHLLAAQAYPHPFRRAVFTNDAHAACVGAHQGRDGGIIVIGTGTIGWAVVAGRHHRVGGWGFPISDEGSGAWLGCEALRRVLWAHDGRIAWTDMLRELFAQFETNPHAIVRWMTAAKPRDFGGLAPLLIEHAARNDPVAGELVRAAAGHIDALADRLAAAGASRLSLVGGLGQKLEPWLAPATKARLVAPAGDALNGALLLARSAADSSATVGQGLFESGLELRR